MRATGAVVLAFALGVVVGRSRPVAALQDHDASDHGNAPGPEVSTETPPDPIRTNVPRNPWNGGPPAPRVGVVERAATTARAWDEAEAALPEAEFRPMVEQALEACAPAVTLAAIDCAEPPCLGAVRGSPPPQDGTFQECVSRALAGRVPPDEVLYWEVPISVRCGDTVEDFWLVGLNMTTLSAPRAGGSPQEAGDDLFFGAMQIGRSAERIAAAWPCP